VAPPAEVVAKETGHAALYRDVRSHRPHGHIVGVNGSEWPVIAGIAGIDESVLVKVVAPWRLAFIVHATEQGKVFSDLVDVVCTAAGHRAKFALADEALTEIGV